MTTPIIWTITRFGTLTTLKLMLMVAVIVGCLATAALTDPAPPRATAMHAAP